MRYTQSPNLEYVLAVIVNSDINFQRTLTAAQLESIVFTANYYVKDAVGDLLVPIQDVFTDERLCQIASFYPTFYGTTARGGAVAISLGGLRCGIPNVDFFAQGLDDFQRSIYKGAVKNGLNSFDVVNRIKPDDTLFYTNIKAIAALTRNGANMPNS